MGSKPSSSDRDGASGRMLVNMNVDVTPDGRVTYGDARQIMQRIP